METRLHSSPLSGARSSNIQCAVEDEALSEFEGTRAGRAIDRLLVDAELVDRLMWRGYRGPEWEQFRAALAEYGYQILWAWCLSDRIFAECRRRGFGGLPRGVRRLDESDAAELAGETVAASLVYFRDKVLIPRVWDPGRGASLKTYFVGTCIRGFSDVYRGWRKENRPLPLSDATEGDVLETTPATNLLAREILRPLAHLDQEILTLTALGYTQVEVAEILGRTAKSVEHRLARLRTLVRERS